MLHLGYFAIPQLGWIVKGAEGNTASTPVANVFLRGQYETLPVMACNLLVSNGVDGRRRQLHRVPSTQQQRHGCCTPLCTNFDRPFSEVTCTYVTIPSGLGKIIWELHFMAFSSSSARQHRKPPLASALTSFLREVGQFAKSQVHFACEVALTTPILASRAAIVV